MSSAAHRIRRQRWELRAPDQDTAFALRVQMRRDIDNVLMPALEQAFDALDSGDEVVHLSRLSLKLKVRNLEPVSYTHLDVYKRQISDRKWIPSARP